MNLIGHGQIIVVHIKLINEKTITNKKPESLNNLEAPPLFQLSWLNNL